MELYQSIGLCAVIAAATGLLRAPCRKCCVPPFALAFAGVALLALSRFTLRPFAEVRFNAAALALPLYFLLASLTAPRGRRTWRALLLAANLPLLWAIAAALVELARLHYASVDFATADLLNAQALFASAAFLLRGARAALAREAY